MFKRWNDQNYQPLTVSASGLHPKKIMHMVVLEVFPFIVVRKTLPISQLHDCNKYCSQLDHLKAAIYKQTTSRISRIFYQSNIRLHISLVTKQKIETWLGSFHSSVVFSWYLLVTIYSDLYRILLMIYIQFPGRL